MDGPVVVTAVVAVVVVAVRVRIPTELEVLRSLLLPLLLVLPLLLRHLLRLLLPEIRLRGPLLLRERVPRQSSQLEDRPPLLLPPPQQFQQQQQQLQLQLQNRSSTKPRIMRPNQVVFLKEQRRAGPVCLRNLPLLHRNPSQLPLLLLRLLPPNLHQRRKLPNLNPNLLRLLQLLLRWSGAPNRSFPRQQLLRLLKLPALP